MKQLKLTTYLTLCVQFEQDPSDENLEKIHTFLQDVQIMEYMPIKDKIINIVNILRGILPDFDVAGEAAFLETGRVMTGLLGYCINLENDSSILGVTYGVYDMIRRHGLYNHILQHCKEDFDIFTVMLRDSINIANIQKISTTASLFDETEYEKWIQTMSTVQDYLTPDLVKAVLEFNAQSDENARALLKNLSDNAAESLNKDVAESRAAEAAINSLMSHMPQSTFEEETDDEEDDANGDKN